MTWEVVLLEQVETWYFTLDEGVMAAVTGAIDLLESEGPTLGRQTVDKVTGTGTSRSLNDGTRTGLQRNVEVNDDGAQLA